MPKCKNDPKSSYTGKEPSPKGLGLCAHAEKVGTIEDGLDNLPWIVVSNNGIKRWVHLTLKTEYSRVYDKYAAIKKLHKKHTHYYTTYNYRNPFSIYVDKVNNTIYVYKINKDILKELGGPKYDNIYELWMYDNLYKKITYKKLFIGVSKEKEKGDYLHPTGKQTKGNTILIHVNKNNYIIIQGWFVFKFKAQSEIIYYNSPMISNEIPYNYALGKNNEYYMFNNTKNGYYEVITGLDPETSSKWAKGTASIYYTMIKEKDRKKLTIKTIKFK